MPYLYLLLDLGSISVPFLFSFHPKLQFHKEWPQFLPALLFSALIFIAWDVYFTHLGVWGFNPEYLVGISYFGLPIEEILFFICIPYACVFTYHSLLVFFEFKWDDRIEKYFTLTLSSVLFLMGLSYFGNAYTSSTFISLSLFLLLLKYILKFPNLSKVYSVYFFLLLPFAIVNGVLTGTGLDTPIVWYNDSENLGIRLGTIPIEDMFYGFELFLLVVSIQYFLKRQKGNVYPA